MAKHRGKRVLYLVITLPVLAAMSIGCLGWFQEQLIFFPEPLDEETDLSWTGADEVFVETDDGARIHGLHFETPEAPRGVVLYFHGNAGNVASWAEVGARLRRQGMDVFLIDYRTYGKSRGSMSEQGLYRDGEAAYDYLIDAGYEPDTIVIHGRSLGTAVATHVAINRASAGVVLETPFTSLHALAGDLYPFPFPSWILRYSFNNQRRIQRLEAPTWVVHGTADEIIPLEHSRRLYESLPEGWHLTIIEGGTHNNLMTFPQYQQDLLQFYDEILDDED